MLRLQKPGKVTFYAGIGGAVASELHNEWDFFGLSETINYTEKSENLMVEAGVKFTNGHFTGRFFAGADIVLSTNCIESEGDCQHSPVYAGLAGGVSF